MARGLFDIEVLMFPEGSNVNVSLPFCLVTRNESRFSQLAAAYEKAPAVTRERLYIEAVESVLRGSRKVIIDSKSSNGNMLYLPIDRLMERRDAEVGTVPMRPSVTVEAEPAAGGEPRQRMDR